MDTINSHVCGHISDVFMCFWNQSVFCLFCHTLYTTVSAPRSGNSQRKTIDHRGWCGMPLSRALSCVSLMSIHIDNLLTKNLLRKHKYNLLPCPGNISLTYLLDISVLLMCLWSLLISCLFCCEALILICSLCEYQQSSHHVVDARQCCRSQAASHASGGCCRGSRQKSRRSFGCSTEG